MNSRRLIFERPHKVTVETTELPSPGPYQLLVETSFSAISAGTEMLVYRGEFPGEMAIDSRLPGYGDQFGYPLAYGYAAVGRVVKAGEGVSREWLGTRVFAFKPHASHFLALPEELYPLPDDITEQEAVFLPGLETAVNLVQDAAPILGEKVLITGQGVVGLLTASLLSRFPLAALVSLDSYAIRRQASRKAGCHASLDPADDGVARQLAEFFQSAEMPGRVDLVLELSGNPAALNTALDWVGFAGRVIVGSWYGSKEAVIKLGGEFHRKRVELLSSQVSTIAPRLSGRWDKRRRLAWSWAELKRVGPAALISHEFAIEEAQQAYELLARHPERVLQVVFRYDR
ncbi:MAG: zinc-binding alcohol dehydrogenase [Desulfurivibrio sp.]|nr:zinc-binding alcohol dehydrogenase [Desulfurivibrio sp.]